MCRPFENRELFSVWALPCSVHFCAQKHVFEVSRFLISRSYQYPCSPPICLLPSYTSYHSYFSSFLFVSSPCLSYTSYIFKPVESFRKTRKSFHLLRQFLIIYLYIVFYIIFVVLAIVDCHNACPATSSMSSAIICSIPKHKIVQNLMPVCFGNSR